MDIHDFAKDLYHAYAESSGWKNFLGNPMPLWKDLPEAIRTHWTAVATKAVKIVRERSPRE